MSKMAKDNLLKRVKVSQILPYETLSSKTTQTSGRGHISLSGAQIKYSAVIDNGVFRLTEPDEQGTYILKPILSDWDNREFSPANENLTMQIASQVYGIQTAENAVCFTLNGEQVYVTKRYDVKPDGTKIQQEDFASLAGVTKDIYGDAHIKNFSVLQTPQGDYRLAPAYDLINSSIHLYSDSIFALQKGLFPGWNREMGADGRDFKKFGELIGLDENTISKEIDRFCVIYDIAEEMIERSLFNEALKQKYRTIYHTRINSFLKVH